MTEAEKLLQETKSAVVAETQTEDICVIDSDLRIIDISEQFKVLGVENDKDVKVMQFRMPKVYKGTDLSAFNISVNYQNARGTKDRYVVTDKKVSGDQIEFSWTVGKTATVYRGDTRFIVCMRLAGSDGVIQKEFNTTLATMTVLEGLEVDNPVIEQEEKDIIAQLLQIVDDKSKEAVQAVTAEGTKQIKAVQAAAQEIAADREQIKTNKADIADLMQTKAGAIINSAKGERIAVGDSSDAFFEGLKLFGKTEQVRTKGYQLFDASKIATKSAGGATVTNNGDGSFTISGSGNLTGNFVNSHVLSNEEAKKLFKAGRVTLKGDKTYPFVYMQIKNTAGLIKELKTLDVDSERYLDLTSEHINSEGFHVSFGIYGSSGSAIIPGTVKPMVYQDGDGTWEPYTGGKPSPSMEYKQDPESSGDGGTIGIGVLRKNMCKVTSVLNASFDGNTGTLVNNAKNNTVKSYIKIQSYDGDKFLTEIPVNNTGKTRKIFSVNGTFNRIRLSFAGDRQEGSIIMDASFLNYGEYTLSMDIEEIGTNKGKISKIMLLNKGESDETFEPFQYQQASLSTPNGLPGIKVDSGGNYTDSNGQQWICDEMDFKRGKYVQRVRQFPLNICNPHYHESYSSDSYYCFDLLNPNINDTKNIYKRAVLCNAFVAKNGSNMQHINDIEGISTNPETRYSEYIYIRVKASRLPGGKDAAQFRKWLIDNNVQIIEQINPIETDIPEETMTAYRNLCTNYPSTVIQNDSGAGMEVEYVADTKQFILDQIKALVQA